MKCLNVLAIFFVISNLPAQPAGSITQGLGTTTVADLMPNCPSNHKTPLGTIASSDGKTWVVPAENNFQTALKISDLYNSCNGKTPANLAAADLSNVPIVDIDPGGEVVTGYLFADNYFELYINDVLVGVDAVPFTPFNSSVVKFRVSKPYTIAVKLVDWEENPGLGSEINNGSNFHPGDGGFIAQFSDGTVTDASWKVQTFYIAPIQDLNSVVELPSGQHSTAGATVAPTCDANCYGIHYDIPTNWAAANFAETGWQNATLYTAAQVTNQAAYTNFANTAWPNAKFIWSSNLILDNLVLARKTVGASATQQPENPLGLRVENPFSDKIMLLPARDLLRANLRLVDLTGREIARWEGVSCLAGEKSELALPQNLPAGTYFLSLQAQESSLSVKLVHSNF